MNNARARAWQLHREALRPPRITNREVGPTGATPSMISGHHDGLHCVGCGYAICADDRCPSASRALDSFAAGYREAKYGGGPGLNAAVPKGWHKPQGASFWEPADGSPPMVSGGMGSYIARRDSDLDQNPSEHANLHAAMLAALGCEVTAKYADSWHVREPSGREWGCWQSDTGTLIAAVERLTAERGEG